MSLAGDGEAFARFWQAAAAPVPVVIVGGGRWGRVWASVIASARGCGQGIAMAARTDPLSAGEWARGSAGVDGIAVFGDLRDALSLAPRPTIAVIASRPRDHVRDALEAIGEGLDVLVEKPLSDRASSGQELIAAARCSGRLLGLGTEFAFLPAFRQCAREFRDRGENALTLRLEWDDPVDEVRYGTAKRRHEEAEILVDLLPHAISIFRIFAPDARLRLIEASQSAKSDRGFLRLSDGAGGCFDLACRATSDGRRRLLRVEAAGRHACVDFGGETARVVIDGAERALDLAFRPFRSTLRLEIGAFFMEAAGGIQGTAVTADLPALLSLQDELERALSRGAAGLS